MKGTTAYDGACYCGGLIETAPKRLKVTRLRRRLDKRVLHSPLLGLVLKTT
jgi:hypothetical protein